MCTCKKTCSDDPFEFFPPASCFCVGRDGVQECSNREEECNTAGTVNATRTSSKDIPICIPRTMILTHGGPYNSTRPICLTRSADVLDICLPGEVCNTYGSDIDSANAASSVCLHHTSVLARGQLGDERKVCLGWSGAQTCRTDQRCGSKSCQSSCNVWAQKGHLCENGHVTKINMEDIWWCDDELCRHNECCEPFVLCSSTEVGGISQLGVTCNECKKEGMACVLTTDEQQFGVCVEDFDQGSRVYKCKANNSGNHGNHADVRITESLTPDLRPSGTRLTLPANTARSFAVVFPCHILRTQQNLVDIALDVGARVIIVGTCYNAEQYKSHKRVEILDIVASSLWIRDYGNFFLLETGGAADWTRIWNLDHQYTNRERVADDLFPLRFAHYIGENTLMNTLRHVHIEGGNVISNGAGLCIMTKLVLCKNAQMSYRQEWEKAECADWTMWGRNQAAPKLEANGWGPMDFNLVKLGSIFDDLVGNSTKQHQVAAFVTDLLRQHFGCEPVFLEGVPYDYGLDHVDMYYFFLNETTILMGTYNETTWAAQYSDIDLTGAHDESGTWTFNSPVSAGNDNSIGFKEQRAFKQYMESARRNEDMLKKHDVTVIRTSMPPRFSANHNSAVFTHLNPVVLSDVTSGNLTVLIPSYEFPTSENGRRMAAGILHETQTIFEDHGWGVKVVDVTNLLSKHGGIHCATKTIPYVQGCAESTTKVRDYYQCLENKIPKEDKVRLGQREFVADIKMRNKITQRSWSCKHTPDLRCELKSTSMTSSTTTTASPPADLNPINFPTDPPVDCRTYDNNHMKCNRESGCKYSWWNPANQCVSDPGEMAQKTRSVEVQENGSSSGVGVGVGIGVAAFFVLVVTIGAVAFWMNKQPTGKVLPQE
eukprot:GEMP01007808.1.p1 GENE.GEMP01007808.1~~GEMP01007808.1.p1  ORF type:complete len:883 (+),score=97.39 GEMP01007808.1:423-3071(+)